MLQSVWSFIVAVVFILLVYYCWSIVHECPSIMQSVKDKNNGYLEPVVGFDWYVTGYCISHFNVEQGLSAEDADENIDLCKGPLLLL